jgi:hypothetical protein
LDIEPETEKAEDLYFSAPSAPFIEKDTENLDAYYIEPKTGNSISIKSACYDPADPSLKSLEKSAFNGMTVIKVLNSKTEEFNKREALHSQRLVKIDGIPVIVEMMVFKKNDCNYIITHVGIEKNFNKTKSHFNNFLKDVRAP